MMPRMFTADNHVGKVGGVGEARASMMPRMFTADNAAVSAWARFGETGFNDAADVHRG